MTEFTKLKIGFALALLGTLFALHPFLDRFAEAGFVYLGYNLKLFYAYALASGLLGLCVYGYALALMSNRSHSQFEKAGNMSYAMAVMVLPVYGGLYLSAQLADRVAVTHVAWAAPAVAAGTGVGWLALSQLLAMRIRARLGEQDRLAKIAQMAHQEVDSLRRAREMFQDGHFDLCVVEAWRGLEARLRQILLSRRVGSSLDSADAVIRAATRRGILQEPTLGLVMDIHRHWITAVSVEPLPRECASDALRWIARVLTIMPGPPEGRLSLPEEHRETHHHHHEAEPEPVSDTPARRSAAELPATPSARPAAF